MPEAKRGQDDPKRMSEYARQLAVSDPFRELAIRDAIAALAMPQGSGGLDVGCGIGSNTLRLAEAVGPASHVTGVDTSSEFLVYARDAAERAGLAARTRFEEGDANRLPFENDTFDWAWSSDCVGYAPSLRTGAIREMARVVRPGGTVAILIYSSQLLLPGYPVLEAHLNATSAGIAPFNKGARPESHYLRALGWLREAGLAELAAETFPQTFQAPLRQEVRDALILLIDMRWPGALAELPPEERSLYERLTTPESPDFILDHPDYYGFFTYTMFRGKVTA